MRVRGVEKEFGGLVAMAGAPKPYRKRLLKEYKQLKQVFPIVAPSHTGMEVCNRSHHPLTLACTHSFITHKLMIDTSLTVNDNTHLLVDVGRHQMSPSSWPSRSDLM